ncbi:YqgE/AlgH family protein [Nocardioides caldifontis]|uniref:YqgE/AlgH family protein n=1 Tax=Nocardioides caldifontis TaxID=2588938 RepID=UPI001EEFC822|nr:YqgE/AlgH family protein [Nocardioides caldifontis]
MDEPVERFTITPEEPAAGRLLVATPALADPNFSHTVVLLLDHDDDGTLGVVVNRPTSVAVASVLPDWAVAVEPPEVLFEGGPVNTDAALAVAAVPSGDGPEPLGFRRLFGATGIIDLDTPPEVLAPAVARLRIFAGYAGWGSGQLEAEIAEGSWYVVDSAVHDVFGHDPARLWSAVLRRQPGELAWVSTRPVDPTLN